MVSFKTIEGRLELVQLYKQNPLEKIFIFTIYQKLYIGFKPWKLIILWSFEPESLLVTHSLNTSGFR